MSSTFEVRKIAGTVGNNKERLAAEKLVFAFEAFELVRAGRITVDRVGSALIQLNR